MKIEFNEDLNGYILTFENGAVAQTQYDIETNRLHADFGQKYLVRYTEYDSELSIEQDQFVDNFVKHTNRG